MKTSILFNIGHILFGVIVGVLVYKFSGENNFTIGLLSITISLLIIILLETIFQPYTARKEFTELANRVNYLVDKVSDRLIETSDIIKILKYGHVHVPSSKTTDVWLELIWNTRRRYWGILYVSPKEIAQTSVFDLALSVMTAKVRVEQVDIKRVFVFETQEAFENSKKAMHACVKHGIQARYAFHDKLKSHLLLQKKLSEIRSLDFVIFDSQTVWLTILDAHQLTKYGEAHFDTRLNEYYSEIFRMIWDTSIECS